MCCMSRWIARWESAHPIGLVRDFWCLFNCRRSISMEEIVMLWVLKMRKLRDISDCEASAMGCMARWMARGDLAHQRGLGRALWCSIDGTGNGSLVGNTLVAAFQIRKIGDVCACSTAVTNQMAKPMVWGDPAHWIGVIRALRCLVKGGGNASLVKNACDAVFQIPKIGDICASSTATIDQGARRMALWVFTHSIGLVCHSKGLADSSWGISKVVNVAVAWEISH